MDYVAESIKDNVDDWTRLKDQLQRMEDQIAELTRLIDPVPAHSHAASDITSGTFGTTRIEDKAVTKGKLSQDLQTKLGTALYTTRSVAFSGTAAKGGAFNFNYTPPAVAGYTAVGAVGVNCNHSWLCVNYLTTWRVTLYNPAANDTSLSGEVTVLYLRNNVLA